MMKTWVQILSVCFFAILLMFSCSKDNDFWDWMIPETEDSTTTAQVAGYVFRPALVDATADNIAQLKVPAGFVVKKFAENLGKPRILAATASGHIYFSDREAGTISLLRDENNDGVSDATTVVARLPQAHGLAILNNTLWIATVKEVYSTTINSDGTLTEPSLIIDDLPDGGQHPNRTLAVGPDGMLYITIGSTCNACPESNPLNATIARANRDGTNLSIFAKGLRNTIGLDWHPHTNELWGLDHGIDWLGDDDQKEELNLIKQNAHYGWPFIYGEGKYNPANHPPGDTTYKQFLEMSTLPALTFQAHAAPMQFVFYRGEMFPEEYRNGAFATLRGSWNRSSPVGYSIVRIHFENGKPTRMEDFLTGFIVNNNKAHFGRPVGLLMLSDGSLIFSDDTNGIVYRISRL